MSQAQTPSPMLARSPGPSCRPLPLSPEPSRRQPSLLPADVGPEGVLDLLRELIADGQISTARSLILEAVGRFPDHPRIRLAKRILNDGKATPSPLAQPTATAEIEWLKNPPPEARGKWVALIGSEVLGMAASFEHLMDVVRAKSPQQIYVVHHLES